MSDKYFFSACVLLGTFLVLMALSPWSDRLPTGAMSAANLNAHDLLIADRDLNRFEAGEVGKVSLKEQDGAFMLDVGVQEGQLYDAPTFGPHLRLEADVERTYAKNTLNITITARHSKAYQPKNADDKMQFEVNYAANASETSGWEKFDLTPDFAEYSFQYRPPGAGDGIGNDFLAIRPSSNSTAYKVIVKSIRFQIMPAN
ncbi:hypothetical protein [Hirschia litorea]|uniref:NADH:ubiquinone oxidoreductase intermediate-associated protein 30 domain-containing protein n=1 Tax=Hirschia litorea TaxID=1199156 RepID=A0ABW2IKU5_9PROT